MRAPEESTIVAPMIPAELPWLNVAMLRMDQQRGRPVLLEFTDLLRPPSLHTSDYLRAWHERYGSGRGGLRVISVFAPALPFCAERAVAERLVRRAGLEHPVLLDLDHLLWRIYENEGWPGRYLFDDDLRLVELHYGEGGYEETEQAIRELLGDVDGPPLGATLHPIDDPRARIVIPTPDQPGAWSGSYEAGEAWALLEGTGGLRVNGQEIAVDGPGPLLLARHERHAAGELELEPRGDVICHGVCFSPGLA